MARIGAILISLCLSTLLASCGSSRSGIDPAARAAAIEQAHQEADAQLALAAQALVEAQAEAETAQACRVALDVATMRFDYIAVIIALANVQASFAEGYWPWPEEAWLADELRIPRQEAQEALSALAEVVEKAARQAQRAKDAAWESAEIARESVETIQALSETFQTDELRAALEHATAAAEKAREAVANAELVTVADAAEYTARLGAELDSLPSAWPPVEKAERHYTRVRTIAGRIAALATETDPDEFPYAHAISLEDFTDLPTWGFPDLGGGWTVRALKTPSSERLIVYSHPDHLRFGWWLTAPENPEHIRFDTFTSGENPLPSGGVVALTGTATYEGPATGLYVERSSGTGDAEKGVFAATVTLTADFDAAGTIAGAVRDFTEDGFSLGAWTVDLMPASLATETDTFRGAIGGAADDRAWDDGTWTGGFFGQTVDGSPSPTAVLGEFHAVTGTPQVEDGDTGFIGLSGAFGAHAKNERNK